ncbi:MAG TPA: prepilin peptidase [Methylomirabilota bacterium]|nr:prepilin peptidase [Methylomirabilota bacterium]
MFDPKIWAAVPFHFWSITFFTFGCIVGSFLNVCIHRMPLGQSIVSPPSHCPHCRYSIPWYLNIPLVTWLYLRGKCAHCGAPIAVRYFLVELLTGVAFLGSWLVLGPQSAGVAVVICLFLAGLIVATFIDFEHFIIPDEITIGGMAAGFVCSLAVPALHGTSSHVVALLQSALGMVVGGGVVYGVLRAGKLMFGRFKVELPPESRVIFTETALKLPNEEIPYEEIFYRKSDTIVLEARRLELIDRCYPAAAVRLSPERLEIGEEQMDPEAVPHMEAVTSQLVLPREAMGFGDVKFMAAIGAFLGWKATLFSLLASSMIGAVVGLMLIALRRQEWSSRIPYGPYIALAAVIWVFGGRRLPAWWFGI